MTTLRQIGYGLALFGALGLLFWGQYQQGQAVDARETLAAERIEQLTQRSARQAASIVRLGNELAAQRLSQQSLQQTITDLRQAKGADHLTKQEIRRNDPSFDSWGAQPLPDAARRLHERPGFTGANAYRQWLPRRHTLQPAASSPAK